jgi:hypothetical protein
LVQVQVYEICDLIWPLFRNYQSICTIDRVTKNIITTGAYITFSL